MNETATHPLRQALKFVAWNLMGDQIQLKARLKYASTPMRRPTPSTILSTSRYALENLSDQALNSYMHGLSPAATREIKAALGNLIVSRSYTTTFPMAKLHGRTAGKTFMETQPKRASCRTMADMGALVDDLRDLHGKQGMEIIDACKAWGQVRLHEGIAIKTDTWHNRFYWCNEAGSHHMAVLCHELRKQNVDWRPEVTMKEYSLNLAALYPLKGSVSVFVITHDIEKNDRDQVFQTLTSTCLTDNQRAKLGYDSVRLGLHCQDPLYDYRLVFIDHSKPYADIALKQMQLATDHNCAQTLQGFMESIKQANEPRT